MLETIVNVQQNLEQMYSICASLTSLRAWDYSCRIAWHPLHSSQWPFTGLLR